MNSKMVIPSTIFVILAGSDHSWNVFLGTEFLPLENRSIVFWHSMWCLHIVQNTLDTQDVHTQAISVELDISASFTQPFLLYKASLKKKKTRFPYFYFICMDALPACVFVHRVCMEIREARRECWFSGNHYVCIGIWT